MIYPHSRMVGNKACEGPRSIVLQPTTTFNTPLFLRSLACNPLSLLSHRSSNAPGSAEARHLDVYSSHGNHCKGIARGLLLFLSRLGGSTVVLDPCSAVRSKLPSRA